MRGQDHTRPVAIAEAGSYDEDTVRASLRHAFDLLGYDAENPLGHVVKPGDSVFIKPNWVAHRYRASCKVQDCVYSTITHPSVIRAVADVVARALQGRGEITIGDNPSIDADFDQLRELMQLDDLQTRHDVPCTLADLRPLRCADLKDYGLKHRMVEQAGDPKGACTVNLGADSSLYRVNPRLFRGVFTDRSETVERHTGTRQEYTFSNSIAQADVYISLPKLKTHHKVGTTLNLKGLVGTVSNKNLLVHWRVGFPGIGGDEYPNALAWLKGHLAKVKNRGAWHGNDTIWRMVVDLYNGLSSVRERRTFSVIDGIQGGEGNGPFCPRSNHAKTLVAGEDLLAVDYVASKLMGFRAHCIPYLRHLMEQEGMSEDELVIRASHLDLERFFDDRQAHLGFVSPTGWDSIRPLT